MEKNLLFCKICLEFSEMFLYMKPRPGGKLMPDLRGKLMHNEGENKCPIISKGEN